MDPSRPGPDRTAGDGEGSDPGRAAAAPADGGFELVLAWSEVTLQVPPGKSALSVLIAAGYPVDPGCETGGCGTCVTDYVEGDLIHKDGCLTESERRHRFCPCVSRAHTRIVLAM